MPFLPADSRNLAPPYQEQRIVQRRTCVTAEEEGNGATPAHLFNFLLCLKPHSDLATVNDDNLGPAGAFRSLQPAGNALCLRVSRKE